MLTTEHKLKRRIRAIALINAIACVLALLIPTSGAVAPAAREPISSQSPIRTETQTYDGMVTDSHCGAKHSTAIGRTATDCAIICVRAGSQFVLIDGDTRYLLDGDPVTLKQVAGQRARIIGTLSGKTISVEAVTALNPAA